MEIISPVIRAYVKKVQWHVRSAILIVIATKDSIAQMVTVCCIKGQMHMDAQTMINVWVAYVKMGIARENKKMELFALVISIVSQVNVISITVVEK